MTHEQARRPQIGFKTEKMPDGTYSIELFLIDLDEQQAQMLEEFFFNTIIGERIELQ